MRKFVTYEEFNKLVNDVNVLKEEYLVRGYIDVSFNQFEKFEYLRYLYNIFRLAKRRIYLFDNEINLDVIYLLKNIPGDVQVTVFTNNEDISLKLVSLFLMKYSNVNLAFRKNNINEKYIVIDYGEDTERIINSKTIVSFDEEYQVLMEYHDKDNYRLLFKDSLLSPIYVLKEKRLS